MDWRELILTFIDDILIPIAVAIFVSFFRQNEFLELAVFLLSAQVLSNIWNRWMVFLVKPARKLAAPFVVPMPALTFASMLFNKMSHYDIGLIAVHYGIYLLYGGVRMVAVPMVQLAVMGDKAPLNDHEEEPH